MGQGFYWQDLRPGQQLRTFRRTITESDLIAFVSVTGMLEEIFIDATAERAIAGRFVPAALTYTFVEGFILQSMVQGTGLALLELTQKVVAPVFVGDSIDATVEIEAVRPTSRGNRAIVDSRIDVYNQHDNLVLTYSAVRLLKGCPDAAAENPE
jgi:acyl dehydratase